MISNWFMSSVSKIIRINLNDLNEIDYIEVYKKINQTFKLILILFLINHFFINQ